MATLVTQIEFRNDTYENLKNIVLAESEPAYATDTGQFVIGDGKSTFAELAEAEAANNFLEEYKIVADDKRIDYTDDIIDQSMVISKVEGRTLVRNNLVDGYFTSAEWYGNWTNVSYADKTATIEITHDEQPLSTSMYLPEQTVTIGHKYFYRFDANIVSNNNTYLTLDVNLCDNWGKSFSINALRTPHWGIVEATRNSYNQFYIYINRDGNGVIGDKVQIKNLEIIDLTLAYGVGKEPTDADYVNKDLPNWIDRDLGTFVHSSSSIESRGRNLWTLGDIEGIGVIQDNYIYLPAGEYYFSALGSSTANAQMLVYFVNETAGGFQALFINKEQQINQKVVLNYDVYRMYFYASDSWVTSQGHSCSFKNIMISRVDKEYAVGSKDVITYPTLMEWESINTATGVKTTSSKITTITGSESMGYNTSGNYKSFYINLNQRYDKTSSIIHNIPGVSHVYWYLPEGATYPALIINFVDDIASMEEFRSLIVGKQILSKWYCPVEVSECNVATGLSIQNGGIIFQNDGISYKLSKQYGLTTYSCMKNNLLIEIGQQRQIDSIEGKVLEGVVGPEASTDGAIARFDGTSGKLIQNSGVIIDDNGNITPAGQLKGTATNAEQLNGKTENIYAYANSIVQRDANGFINNTYYKSSSPRGQITWNNIDQFIVTEGTQDDAFYKKASFASVYNRLNYVRSPRCGYTESDVPYGYGTLVKTNLTWESEPAFLMHIKSNSYLLQYPYNIYIQGYIYQDYIIHSGAISIGTEFTAKIYALKCAAPDNTETNPKHYLYFWWPYIAYWQGFDVSVERVQENYCGNTVSEITWETQPMSVKTHEFKMRQVAFADVQQEIDTKVNNTYWLSGGTSLSEDSNLNNITTIGNYYCSSDDVSTKISNKPTNVVTAFILKVEASLGTVGSYVSQTLRTYNDGKLWFRKSNDLGKNWSTWTQYAQLSDIPSIPNLSLVDASDTTANPLISGLAVNGHQITVTRKSLADLGLASAYKYKGSVATVENLPTSNNVTGDVYNVESNGVNYAWDGSKWDSLGGTVDLSGYLPLSGGYMTGPIGFKGSKNNWPVIQFIDNTEDINGVGVKIGAGGTVIIGGGESADEIHNALIANGGAESLILSNDWEIDFYTNCQNGYSSAVHTSITETGEFTGKLDWSNLLNNPITIKYLSGESVDNRMTDTWKQMGGRTSGPLLAAYYPNFTTANWVSSADSTVVFGAADTKGFLSTSYHSPIFSIGGGNVGDSTDADPRWYMKFTGTNGVTYDLDSFANSNSVDNISSNIKSIHNWLEWSGLNQTITVEGNADTYYPVMIELPTGKSAPTFISIYKDLGTATPNIPGNHENGTSSLWLMYEGRYTGWDGNGGYIKTLYKSEPYGTLCAHSEWDSYGWGGLIVWLRGGNCVYNITTSNTSTVQIKYEETNISSSDYPHIIGPRTEFGNRGEMGKLNGTVYYAGGRTISDWLPNYSNYYNLGTQDYSWRDIWAKGTIIAHKYASNNTLPAITMDKLGSYAVGIGADGTTDRIKFGPADLAGTTWYNTNTFNSNEWYFQGYLTTTNTLKAPTAEVETLYSDQLVLNPNSFSINFRPGVEAYTTGFYYGTASNEGLTLATQQSCTSIQFINGQDPSQLTPSSWATLVPALQIKYNKVAINKALGADRSPRAELDVSGTVWATNQFRTDGVQASWYTGRDAAAFRTGTSNEGYYPALSMKTTNGSWELGAYNYDTFHNIPLLTYITDDNYNNNSNTKTYQLQFPMANGILATQEQTVSRVHYGTTDQKSSGYYKVNIKSNTSHWMVAFTIRVYQSYYFYDINISGYSYYLNAGETNAQYWFEPRATLSDSSADSIDVYFGANTLSAPHDLWVAIPAGSYTGIDIVNVTNGYYQFPETNLNDVFSIEYVENLSNIQTTTTAYRPIKLNEKISIPSYINGTYGYIPIFNGANSITNSNMKMSKGNHRLVIGEESESITVGPGGIGIRDMRKNDITRDMLGDYTFGMYFHDFSNQGVLPGLSSYPWMSVLHAKGWTGEYQAWELAGPAGTGDVDYGLYYRNSKGSSNTEWNSWHKVAFEDWVVGAYYNKAEVDQKIADAITGGTVDLSGYLTIIEAANTYAKKTDIPTKTSQLTNDSGYITGNDLSGYATQQWVTNQNFSKFSGSYNDLTNKPTIPTKVSELVNDEDFITSDSIPTKTSQLNNDSGFITGDNYYTKTEADNKFATKNEAIISIIDLRGL